jgi:hypothetical protein
VTEHLFEESGPHRIQNTPDGLTHMTVSLPEDEHGMIGRECGAAECSPGLFKVKPGTGIVTEPHDVAFCPYCRHPDHPTAFATADQVRYAQDIAIQEAARGVNRMISRTLGLGPNGKKKIGGGMFSVEFSLKSRVPTSVARPLEEELRRDIVCDGCGLAQAVFGLASWSHDCGRDVFLQHVHEELVVIRKALADVDDRRQERGARVAARDIENALEDLVSIFEAAMKHMTREHLRRAGRTPDEVSAVMATIRNAYQNVASATTAFRAHVQGDLMRETAPSDEESLRETFEKRHPITHNLGVIDRQYLRRAQTGELEGREIRITVQEVVAAVDVAEGVLQRAYAQACPTSIP